MHSLPSLELEESLNAIKGSDSDHSELRAEIDHAAHLLPSQGPITVFVHHNTLHSFEELSFDEGVQSGGMLYSCHAYLPENQYRQMLTTGRIRLEDLDAVLRGLDPEGTNRTIAELCTRRELRLAMLLHPLYIGPTDELRWVVAETDALRKFRPEAGPAFREHAITDTRTRVAQRAGIKGVSGDESNPDSLGETLRQFNGHTPNTWDERKWENFVLNYLWRVCCDGVQLADTAAKEEPAATQPVRRLRDVLLDAGGEDADELVNEVLIRLTSAFLDQGYAQWELPGREAGLFESFLRLYRLPLTSPTRWYADLNREVKRISAERLSPLESIAESLELIGVSPEDREQFVLQTLMVQRGWAGMVWQMETNAEWAPYPAPPGSLVEFLAVRLVLDRVSAGYVARQSLGYRGSLNQIRDRFDHSDSAPKTDGFVQRAFILFQLAQVRSWTPGELDDLSRDQWLNLVHEVESFTSLERRLVYHHAFERKYRNETLDALVLHSTKVRERQEKAGESHARPKFQLVTCIDDREESFRRHLEEVEPECETFGIPGFYGTAMYYRGAGHAHFKPLCPIAIKPSHYVIEESLYSLSEVERRRSEARRTLGLISHRTHIGTRSFLGGILTTLGGSLAAFPLVGRILFPSTVSRLLDKLSHIVKPPQTQLRIERLEPNPGSENGQLGYSIDEMTAIVEGVLRAAGMTRDWSSLVIFLGHGSESLNNPHESAYNCGACAGSQGGPNARAFALMANDFRVRRKLEERGLAIPDWTWFVGGYHDTTNEAVTFADLDRMPVSHRREFEYAVQVINEARERNAHERCRRFESAPLDISLPNALRHVQERPQDLSQARPEYNHATNALCFVGKRSWSRGLFLDRRAFLTSYDSTQDDDRGSILEGILRAAIPVCAGISLEYYFSTIDVEGYGCGSKLPHNITSLLGVMSGAASDLRPGLSQQMIEIHEPMRILFVIETSAGIMHRIIRENEPIRKLVEGGWVQLAILEPATSQIEVYDRGQFVPYTTTETDIPSVNGSFDWYRNRRDHLGFVSIKPPHRPSLTPQGVEI